jgi:hypothetical protein
MQLCQYQAENLMRLPQHCGEHHCDEKSATAGEWTVIWLVRHHSRLKCKLPLDWQIKGTNMMNEQTAQ